MLKFTEIAIDISDVSSNPRPAELREMQVDLNAALGGNWQISRSGSFWHVMNVAVKSGDVGLAQRLDVALREATGCRVIMRAGSEGSRT